MKEQWRTVAAERLGTFVALRWYEVAITFVFHFIAKTSELLLAAGLVVSTANFLTDGMVMEHNEVLATVWAWAQAVAIDSSLGVTFFSVFSCLKERDWLKAGLYGVLTLLLALVAGTITNIDTFRHALHVSMASATTQVGLDLGVLTTLRAIAVIGFVMMSRLKDVSFKDLYRTPLGADHAPVPAEPEPAQGPALPDHQMLLALMDLLQAANGAEQRSHLLRLLAGADPITIKEEDMVPEQIDVAPCKEVNIAAGEAARSTPVSEHVRPEPLERDVESQQERDGRIERAYQELKAEGKRISGRALAERAHVHRATCTRWLERASFEESETPAAEATASVTTTHSQEMEKER